MRQQRKIAATRAIREKEAEQLRSGAWLAKTPSELPRLVEPKKHEKKRRKKKIASASKPPSYHPPGLTDEDEAYAENASENASRSHSFTPSDMDALGETEVARQQAGFLRQFPYKSCRRKERRDSDSTLPRPR